MKILSLINTRRCLVPFIVFFSLGSTPVIFFFWSACFSLLSNLCEMPRCKLLLSKALLVREHGNYYHLNQCQRFRLDLNYLTNYVHRWHLFWLNLDLSLTVIFFYTPLGLTNGQGYLRNTLYLILVIYPIPY